MDAEECTNWFTNSILRYPICSALVNPLHFSIMLTCVIMIIVLAVYAEDCRCKTTFWIFIVIATAICLNNRLMIKQHRDESMSDTQRNISDVLTSGPSDDTDSTGDDGVLQKINPSANQPSMIVGIP